MVETTKPNHLCVHKIIHIMKMKTMYLTVYPLLYQSDVRNWDVEMRGGISDDRVCLMITLR